MKHLLNVKTLRIALYAGIFVISSLLFFDWEVLTAQEAQTAQASATAPAKVDNGAPNLALTASPQTTAPEALTPQVPSKFAQSSDDLITVDTPLYTLKIDPKGGDIVAASLKNYQQGLQNSQPFMLLGTDPNSLYYIVQSGLVTSDKTIPNNIPFASSQKVYTLTGTQPLAVNLTWHSPSNVLVTKTYMFYPNQYTLGVNYTLKNQGAVPLTTRFYGELSRMPPNELSAFWNSYTNYVGAAISYPDDHYQKITFANMVSAPLNQTVASGWVAMLQHYFITAWIPANHEAITQFSSTSNNVYSIGMANASITIASGQSANTGATLYLGPAIAEQLGQVAPYLDKTVDYGWLWFISELIFQVMQWVHHYVGNWGVAIILVTVLIKLMFYPLSAKSFRSMARMRELQPRIAELRKKFGDDRQKLGMATMELYRKEKVNPLGGCLPMLVQIPVFIALYWVIMESVELRQAPFFGWIHDLSAKDPYFILPVLMGLSMFVQQRLSPKPPDPMQAKLMMALPIVFTVMFLTFPSGLVLYWFVNNCLSVLQQWWVTRQTLKQDGFKKLSEHPSKWHGK